MRKIYGFPIGSLAMVWVGLPIAVWLTMLALAQQGGAGATKPGASTGDQAKARALLKDAHDQRATLGKNFPGFRADLIVHRDGTVWRGSITFTPPMRLEVVLPDDKAQPMAQHELQSMIAHRLGTRRFEEGDGRYTLTLGPDDAHPLGRLIYLNDPIRSSYRVRDAQVLQVHRTAEGRRFTITILENQRTSEGQYLPKHFTVSYFAADTGALLKTETFTDEYRLLGGFYLPASRRIVVAEKGETQTWLLQLENHRLLEAKQQP